jgi:hypothetical protein
MNLIFSSNLNNVIGIKNGGLIYDILEDKKFTIDFKINNHNYYVCDNKFTSKFIIYFLNEYYSQEIKGVSLDKLQNYEVSFLDHNVSQKSFDTKCNIKIDKNGYTIFTE